MTNAASRDKKANNASNTNNASSAKSVVATSKNTTNGKNASAGESVNPTTNTPATPAAAVKPTGAKGTAAAAQTPNVTATAAADPTRAASSAGKANTGNKQRHTSNNNSSDKSNNTSIKNSNAFAVGSHNKSNGKVTNTKAVNTTPTNVKSAKTMVANASTRTAKSPSVPHAVGASFVLRLVLGLSPEKRAACQLVREILTHESKARLVLTPTGKGLKPAIGEAAADARGWAKLEQHQLRQMARQAQSDKFQEAMQQLGGEYLYDALRSHVVRAAGDATVVWDAAKDKPSLQAKSLCPSTSLGQTPKIQQQAVKKTGAAPPPAPVNAKVSTAVKNATPMKNVSAGAWGGAAPAAITQSCPGAIVSSAPTVSARVGGGGRAKGSRAH